jgi:hypothetical protein
MIPFREVEPMQGERRPTILWPLHSQMHARGLFPRYLRYRNIDARSCRYLRRARRPDTQSSPFAEGEVAMYWSCCPSTAMRGDSRTSRSA